MRILIGYDGSECSDAAMTGLARAGLPEDCDATVLSVADIWIPAELQMPPGAGASTSPRKRTLYAQEEAALEAARSLAEQGRQKLQQAFPQWRVTAEACADSPAWSIIKRSSNKEHDLVVVGSHGRSGFGRLFLGSVSMRVLTELTCPVRIGRPSPSTGPIRVLVGADGSDDACAAIQAIAQRHWPADTQIQIVTAANWRLHSAPVAPPLLQGMPADAWAERIVSYAHERLADRGLTVTTVTPPGDAKSVLVEHAKNWNADCIFVGAQGKTRAQRMMLGSVSLAVAMRATCSVEVVHATAT